MSRVDMPEEQRRDFFLYVDEFQNFATDSFANILSEARKYRLGLILAHQYIGQLVTAEQNTKVRDAVFGNVGTIISFRVGAEDAEFLEKEFMPEFLQTDLVNLSKANIYIKLMIDGVASRPFSAETLPPQKLPLVNYRDVIMKNTRDRYGTPRSVVEARITSDLLDFGGGGAVEEKMERRGERGLAEMLGQGASRKAQVIRNPRTFSLPRQNTSFPQNIGTTSKSGERAVVPATAAAPVKGNSEKPKPLTPLEAAVGVKNPPQPKKFPKQNVDIEALRKAIHESLRKQGENNP